MRLAYEAVEWAEDMPPEIRTAVDSYLQHVWRFVPSWVREFRVTFKADLGPTSAEMTANYAYRWGRLDVGPAWLLGSPLTRRREMAHELCHLLQAPVQAFVENELGTMEPATAAHWRDALEATVTDLGWVLTSPEMLG